MVQNDFGGGVEMKILVIGSGGREHALVWKLAQSPRVEKIYCAPGNGGIAQLAECVAISPDDIPGLIQFVKQEGIELTVVGPEDPLLNGIVNQFAAAGLLIYGPSREAAMIEGSKSYAKKLMRKYNIPTAAYEEFTDYETAWSYVQHHGVPIVIKADGLAAGKGVIVAHSLDEARVALEQMLTAGAYGKAGAKVVIEEFLQGEELTLLSFVDGSAVLTMEPAQDHKAVYDGDLGPNTGGMGCYSPVPHIPDVMIKRAVKEIIQPVAQAMVQEGTPFRGILYTGLMITADGPKVIEFNARFGDPETEVILPRLKNDLVDIFMKSLSGELNEIALEWSEESALTVIIASEGYPGRYQKNLPITGLERVNGESGLWVFHAGTVRDEEGTYRTSGGRVLAVTALGDSIAEAKEKAYQGVEQISFPGAHYRTDIGYRAIK
jgi:phosphoribosylamine--glycine ligase